MCVKSPEKTITLKLARADAFWMRESLLIASREFARLKAEKPQTWAIEFAEIVDAKLLE